jgi:tetratricopeptide (TPR) repeat protein
MSHRRWNAFTFVSLLIFFSAVLLRAQDNVAWADFQQKAAAWRALPVKPAISEEVRLERVQAENAVKEKRLAAAVEHYQAGLKMDPAWPEGHFNAGLIYAELGEYDKAVWHMRAYVELVPDAPDARGARDQIAIWKDKERLLAAEAWRDPVTMLFWTKEDNGSVVEDWNQANSYCQNLNLGGFNGWRLPTQAEIAAIFDKKLKYHNKGNIKLTGYMIWTSNKNRFDQHRFDMSPARGGHWDPAKNYRVLCVRPAGG